MSTYSMEVESPAKATILLGLGEGRGLGIEKRKISIILGIASKNWSGIIVKE